MVKFFIIPGAGESTKLRRYKELSKKVGSLGYIPVLVNPNWDIEISKQIFKIGKNDIIFGFSRGAILAYITSKKYPCKLVILGSMPPIKKFSKKEIISHYGDKIGNDIYNIKLSANKNKQIRLAGEFEKIIDADIYISKTRHYLSKSYIKQIIDLLK